MKILRLSKNIINIGQDIEQLKNDEINKNTKDIAEETVQKLVRIKIKIVKKNMLAFLPRMLISKVGLI